jgi:tetratricopeptide (TPR) repeat protein
MRQFFLRITVLVMASAIASPAILAAQQSPQVTPPKAEAAKPGTSTAPKAPAPSPTATPAAQPGTVTPAAPQATATSSAETPAAPDDYALYLQSGDHNAQWDEFIQLGFQTFDAGNLATAGIFLKQAYDRGCRDPLLLYRLGIIRESRGLYKEAADMLAQAAELIEQRYPGHPFVASLPKNAGRALFEAEDYKRALPLLQKALEREPNDFMLLLLVGQIQRMDKHLTEARASFERALAVPPPPGVTKPNPQSTLLGELIAITYQQKDLEACQRYVDQALALNPADQLANAYRRQLAKELQSRRQREMIEKMIK